MSTKDIKVGETYNIRVRVVKNDFGDTGEIATVTVDENGKEIDGEVAYYTEADAASFSPITPEKGNSEPAPKYDPFRLFKKCDKVRVVERDGRDYIDYDPYTNIQKSELYTVLENENEVIDGGCIDIRIGKGDIEYEIPFYFLELVTPAEELDPYSVVPRQEIDEPDNYLPYYAVLSSGCEVARFYVEQYKDGQAKSAAEAECARLNAEHRKEQE
jgi:hypothetical protein